MTNLEIADRIRVIEAELAVLKANVPVPTRPHPAEVFKQLRGTFDDDTAFREAARLGRKWRQSERVAGKTRGAKRK